MSEETKTCPICGEDIKTDTVKCEHCDSEISEKKDSQDNTDVEIKPGDPEKVEVIESEDKPSLWNPNAAACWCILFTPIFGSILIMKNWKSLNNESEAKKGLYWAIGVSVLALVHLFFIDLDYLFIVALIIWYFAYAKKQAEFVKTDLANKYNRKPWVIPLISGFIGLALFVMINTITSEYSDIEESAIPVVNQIIMENFGATAASCEDVIIEEEISENNYRGVAVLDNGNEIKISVKVIGDNIYVQILE